MSFSILMFFSREFFGNIWNFEKIWNFLKITTYLKYFGKIWNFLENYWTLKLKIKNFQLLPKKCWIQFFQTHTLEYCATRIIHRCQQFQVCEGPNRLFKVFE